MCHFAHSINHELITTAIKDPIPANKDNGIFSYCKDNGIFSYRVAQKNRTAYLPQYVDGITGIGVWGSSPEKNDTKINFGSVVYFLGHILWDNVETQFLFSLFSLNYAWMNAISACHCCEQYKSN